MRLSLLPIFAALIATGSSPLVAKPVKANKPTVRIYGYAENAYGRSEITDRATARESWVIARTGSKFGDPSNWLPPSDPAFTLIRRNPHLEAQATVAIFFNEAAEFQSCAVTRQTGTEALIEGICDRLKLRAKIVPPMRRDGQKLPENLNMVVTIRGSGSKTVEAPPPVITPFAPRNWFGGKTPTYAGRLLAVSGMPLVPNPAAVTSDEVKTGITVQVEFGRPVKCIIGSTTGDGAEFERACELALKATYSGETSGPTPVLLPLLFVGTGNAMAGLAPRHHWVQSAKIKPEARTALATLVAQTDASASIDPVVTQALVDEQGAAIDCWLNEGSGSDRADLKICEYLMEGQHFEPGEDIFGRPAQTRIHRLVLGDARK